ncbi:MAG: serine/threonine protein kinase [bacterium]|nr:serine/threonine protein kinase [bacterium]
MRAERWQRIETLFAAAARRPARERQVFLRAECAEDPALIAEVEQLLDADDRAGSFIEQAVDAGASAFAGDRPGARIDRGIGSYRLIRRLGRGGMSSVYLAERADAQFRKRVAVKLVRRGMDTEDILRRFRAERQILAGLDHPNIARLYDGGTTEDGLPFFVMEYIDGLSIDAYCDRRRLSVEQRLRLVLEVCSAVHYAHCNLVVHRDLKPSNVLVTTSGTPKLLDFGIAKLLNPEIGDGTLAPTGQNLRLMTPGYASPEQIRGGSITTASDVYSLGVLLFELLTGRRPHRFEGRAGDGELRLASHRPEKPSAAVLGAGERDAAENRDPTADVGSPAEDRGTTRDRLRRTLQGDLDNVVLMALRQEPTRRYRSVEQLSEDIERYLGGRPVIARRDTVGYRAAKFVRRHLWGVVMASGFLVLTAVLIVALAVQSARVSRERDRARRDQDRATRVSAMLKELFEIADPGEVRGSTITARELLDRGAEQIRQLEDDPETAVLLDTLARLYEELGLYGRAVPLRERSLGIYQTSFGDSTVEVAGALRNLAVVLAWRGDFATAEPYFRRALDLRRRLHDGDHAEIVGGINNLALILHDLGEYRQAAPLYEEGLAMQRRVGDEDEIAERFLRSNQALLFYDMGHYRRAEEIYREVLAGRRRAFGDQHLQVAEAHDDLGTALHARGELAAAEEHLRAALELKFRLHGEQYRGVARSRLHLGRLLCDRGELQAAEALLRGSLERRLALVGEDHPEVAASLEGMAAWHARRGEADEAERLYRRALEIYRSSLPEGHPLTVETLLALGRLLEDRGDCQSAVPMLRQALQIRRAKLAVGSWPVDEAANALGGCLLALGQGAEARLLLAGSDAALVAELGAEHPRSRRVRARLALLEVRSKI